MKPPTCWVLGIACAVGLLSGCSGSDNVPIISPIGPTASTDDQRTPDSDALTSQETALISQADSEPEPSQKPDI